MLKIEKVRATFRKFLIFLDGKKSKIFDLEKFHFHTIFNENFDLKIFHFHTNSNENFRKIEKFPI